MSKCKRCNQTTIIEEDYETGDESECIEIVKAMVCVNCGCAHWETKDKIYYEYSPQQEINTNQVAGWAQN